MNPDGTSARDADRSTLHTGGILTATGKWGHYPWEDQTISAYLAEPGDGKPHPGVLVIQEIWGVDTHIQDVARRVADLGYIALAPELYSAGGIPPELSQERIDRVKAFLNTLPPGSLGTPGAIEAAVGKLPPEEGTPIGETFGRLFARRDDDRMVSILQGGLDHLRSLPEVGERSIGSIGFCMGGAYAGLLACRSRYLAATVVFYGMSPSGEEASRCHGALLGLYGGEDPRITGGVPAFDTALGEAGVPHEMVVYPGAPHAFFNDTRPSYRPEAARDAWARVQQFYRTHLGT